MLDTLIRGALVVDGTGSEPFSADVGLKDGKVVRVGEASEEAAESGRAACRERV